MFCVLVNVSSQGDWCRGGVGAAVRPAKGHRSEVSGDLNGRMSLPFLVFAPHAYTRSSSGQREMRKGEAECKQLAVVTVHTEPHVYMIYFKPQHSAIKASC